MADANQPDQTADAPKAPPEKKAAPPGKPAAAQAEKKPAKKPAVMATTPWESDFTKMLAERFGDQIVEFSTYVGQNFLIAKPEAVVQILEFLKNDADFDYLVDVTAVDYPQRPERFDVVYVLYSFARNERIRIKTRIAESYTPQSVVSVHLGANWLEREVYDMFGIRFANHPDMKRILLPEEWEGYPLRKDYGIIDMDNRWVKDNLGIESGQ